MDGSLLLVTGVLALTSAGCLLFTLVRRYRASTPRHAVPKDTVLIYGLGRGMSVPCPSNFPLKLETFCRLAKIPYMVDHSGRMSTKGKSPWMEYNGQVVADSQLCIEHLKAERGVSLDSGLNPTHKAHARALRAMVEENLYWTMCYELFVQHPEAIVKVIPYSGLKLWTLQLVLGRVIRNELWGHGIGRHGDADIWNIAVQDLQALSDFLGDKKYFLGDEPHEVDCCMFGLLAQVVYHLTGLRHNLYVTEHLPNLVAYVERMKARVWPDWNERCKGGNYVDDEYKLYRPDLGNGYSP